MFRSVHRYSFSGKKSVSVSVLLIGRHSCLSSDTGLSSFMWNRVLGTCFLQ